MNPNPFAVVTWRRKKTADVRQVVVRLAGLAMVLDLARELRTSTYADWCSIAIYEAPYRQVGEWTWTQLPPGRPRSLELTDDLLERAHAMRDAGDTVRAIARSLGVPKSTLYEALSRAP